MQFLCYCLLGHGASEKSSVKSSFGAHLHCKQYMSTVTKHVMSVFNLFRHCASRILCFLFHRCLAWRVRVHTRTRKHLFRSDKKLLPDWTCRQHLQWKCSLTQSVLQTDGVYKVLTWDSQQLQTILESNILSQKTIHGEQIKTITDNPQTS